MKFKKFRHNKMKIDLYTRLYFLIKDYGPITCNQLCKKIAEIHNIDPEYAILRINSEVSGCLSGLSQNGYIKALPHKKDKFRKTKRGPNEWMVKKVVAK